jgi:apolipoprotein N-acyltransferase
MDLRADARRLGAGLAAAALTALLWWFGNGLHPVWWLTWLVPLPVLWLAPRVRWPWAALAAFVGAATGCLNQWTYVHDYIGLPPGVIAWVVIAPGLMLAACTLLFRRLLLRGRPLAASLAVPALWVAVQYVNTLTSPHGTFGAIAFMQMDALPVLQLAAVTGLWGIGFLLHWLPAALAAATVPARAAGRWAGLALCAAVLLGTLGYGLWRLQQPATGSVRVGLVSLERPTRPPLASADGQALLQRYLAAVQRLADRGATVVVIPETSFATAERTVPAFAALARDHRIVLDVGIEHQGTHPRERNMAMVVPPTGDAPATYSKHHLIPGLEDRYAPGTGYRLLDDPQPIGLAVCKDMDFHDVSRIYAALGARLLLVPAWDFSVDGWLHSRMAVMRGVENGFAIARAARSGRLTLSDDRGRVVAEASSETQDAELVGDLPLHHDRTLYARWGDWFAYVDLVLLGLVLAIALWRVPPEQKQALV